ncbi:uncharacterized protein [Drosophila virilis]|uniref:Seminal fluid protein n=1 Tax=Drosophila virilis TaxID=7244 RepID=B4LJR8_DROVI|nr:uncharacterized protein LOC6626231 [Drosophila virilis]EDW60577.2 uncharacterized protein Dvir_GJ20776 [Drosophila virilis]
MKAVLLISIFLALVVLSTSSEQEAKASNLESCRRKVRANCQPNGKICVRIARSNLCELRSYSCKQRLANCKSNSNTLTNAFYQRVNIKLCSGMSINQSLPCVSGTNNAK